MTGSDAVLEAPIEALEYQLEEKEFARGYTHFLRQNRKGYLILAILAFFYLLGMNLFLITPGVSDVVDYIQINISLILVVCIGFFLLRKVGLYKTKKNLRVSPFYKLNLTASWNDEGFTITSDNGFNRYEWHHFRAWSEDDQIYVLFYGPHLFITLPKRAFSDQQHKSLKAQLRKVGVSPAKLMPF